MNIIHTSADWEDQKKCQIAYDPELATIVWAYATLEKLPPRSPHD